MLLLLVIFFQKVCPIKGSEGLHCLDNTLKVRSVNSSWLDARGCKCFCNIVKKDPLISCDSCPKILLKTNVIIMPVDTIIYSTLHEIELYCIVNGSEKTTFIVLNNPDFRRDDDFSLFIGGASNTHLTDKCAQCDRYPLIQCYKPYTENITLTVLPLNIEPTSLQGQKVKCVVAPIEVITRGLIKNVNFISEQNFPRNSPLEFTISYSKLYVCFICSHVITVKNRYCYPSFRPIFNVLPVSPYYFKGVEMTLRCVCNYPNISDHIPGLRFYFVNASLVRKEETVVVMDKFNTEKVCFYCSIQRFFEGRKEACYIRYDTPFSVIIFPSDSKIYFPSKPSEFHCEVYPLEVSRLVKDLFLWTDYPNHENVSSTQVKINNFRYPYGPVKLTCGSDHISFYEKIYSPYDKVITLSITPEDTKIYLPMWGMMIVCHVDPLEVVGNDLIKVVLNSSKPIQRISEREFWLNGSHDQVCFECGGYTLTIKKRCYNMQENLDVEILPSNTTIYTRNVQMKIICMVYPTTVITDNLIEGIDFDFNNSTYPPSPPREITIFGTNLGRICFTCGHRIFKSSVKCYDYYSNDIKVEIFPNDTVIYLPRQVINFTCIISPEEVIKNRLIWNVSFYRSITPLPLISERTIQINGDDIGQIDLKCEHIVFEKTVSASYAYYGTPITLEILPDKTIVYFASKVMDVTCVSNPREVIDKPLITGILLSVNSRELQPKSERLFQIDGRDLGELCFECKHRLLTTATRCYQYLNMSVSLSIEPHEVDIFIPNKIMNVMCVVTPINIMSEGIINDIHFSFHNSTGSKTSDTSIKINGLDTKDICFKCTSAFIDPAFHCYKYYATPVTINIIPNDTTIYFVDSKLDIYCEYYPPILHQLIRNISLTTNYNKATKVSDLHIVIENVKSPYPVITATCGDKFISKAEKTYRPFEYYNLTIYPDGVDIYLVKKKNEAICKVNPVSLLTFLPNIDFFHSTIPFRKVSKRVINFGPFYSSPGRACFQCGHRIMKNVTKCYQPYIGEVTVSVGPTEEYIYYRYIHEIKCEYYPIFMKKSDMPFELFGIEKNAYRKNTINLIIIIRPYLVGTFRVCAVCGMMFGINASRCYTATDESVYLEIIPKVTNYLTYILNQDVRCFTYPREAMHQFEATRFTKVMPRTNYNFVNDRHVKMCVSICEKKEFCFTCYHKELRGLKTCYIPFDDPVNISIVPNVDFLPFMTQPSINCTYYPYFTTPEFFDYKMTTLGIDDYKKANLSIIIEPNIHLLNREACVNCSIKDIKTFGYHCYNITADIELKYKPHYNIYMVMYNTYEVITYFKFGENSYPAMCTLTSGPLTVPINNDKIILNNRLLTGIYHFMCNLEKTSNNYPLSLEVYKMNLKASIFPNETYIYYMYNPNITCEYSPLFIGYDNISFKISGLKKSQYVRSLNVISIKEDIMLSKINVCVNCAYLNILNISRCYILYANVTFNYSPKNSFYMTHYHEFEIETAFYHKKIFKKIDSTCVSLNNTNNGPVIKDGVILLKKDSPPSGYYTIRCKVKDSLIYEDFVLKVFQGIVKLSITPTEKLNLLRDTYTVISCNVIPSDVIIKKKHFDTEHRKHLERLPNGSIVLETALSLYQRCICFYCVSVNYPEIKTKICYKFEMTLVFQYFPKQQVYFSWSNLTIYVFYMNIYRPEKIYPANCRDSIASNFTFSSGKIHLNPSITTNVYFLDCDIARINLKKVTLKLHVIEHMVYLFITPNSSSVYILSEPMDVQCLVIPESILKEIPTIRFIHVSSQDVQFVSNRSLIIGGPGHISNDVICVTCGDELLPVNQTKCYSPYSGPINMTIEPDSPDLQFQLSHVITCRFTPAFINYSKVSFRLLGLPKGSFKLDNDLKITIYTDKTLTNRNICVICGDKPKMNISRCYFLGAPAESKTYVTVMTIFILSFLAFVIYYIQNYEIM